jgi:PhzF family phenazine biosynthesis protein
MELEVYFVDSFTSKVFGGNPAGVVFHEQDLDHDLMQNIAAENNLSETAFVHTSNNNRIKFFTPELEVDLCGHATLASAFTYFNFLNTSADEIVFQANRSQIKAVNANNGITLSLPKDEPIKVDDVSPFTEALNAKVLEVYRGIDDFVAVLEDEEAVKNNNPDFSLIKHMDSRGLIVTAKGNVVDFVSRWYGPQTGINEDPATGSAHALLGTYWAGIFNKDDLTAKQLSKRGGLLHCSVKEQKVDITGQAALYLRGTLHIT